jgi:hypothetical protein
MRLMLAAARTEFLEFQPFCRGSLVLGIRVVAFLTLSALERYDFACHIQILSVLLRSAGFSLRTGLTGAAFKAGLKSRAG